MTAEEKEYLVSYKVIGAQTVMVRAKSKSDAIRKAKASTVDEIDFRVIKRLSSTYEAKEQP